MHERATAKDEDDKLLHPEFSDAYARVKDRKTTISSRTLYVFYRAASIAHGSQAGASHQTSIVGLAR